MRDRETLMDVWEARKAMLVRFNPKTDFYAYGSSKIRSQIEPRQYHFRY